MDRRTYLRLTGALAVPFAGCAGDGPDEESSETTPTSTATSTTTDPPPTVTTTATEPSPTTTESTAIHDEYETTEVTVQTPGGTELGSVTAAVAATQEERLVGLSDTDALPADRGMLFVFESVADRTFVMREMDFGIDIVYADAGGTITRIHHAQAPGPDEDGSQQRYPGRGRYVLELVYDWTTTRGVTGGDRLAFDRTWSPTE